jgi:hypothetical protein
VLSRAEADDLDHPKRLHEAVREVTPGPASRFDGMTASMTTGAPIANDPSATVCATT